MTPKGLICMAVRIKNKPKQSFPWGSWVLILGSCTGRRSAVLSPWPTYSITCSKRGSIFPEQNTKRTVKMDTCCVKKYSACKDCSHDGKRAGLTWQLRIVAIERRTRLFRYLSAASVKHNNHQLLVVIYVSNAPWRAPSAVILSTAWLSRRLRYASVPYRYFGGNLARTSRTAFLRSLEAASVLM